MADTTPNTTRTHGRPLFALIDVETDETIVLIHQWNNGDLTVSTPQRKAVVKEFDPASFTLTRRERDGTDLPPDQGRRKGRGRRP